MALVRSFMQTLKTYFPDSKVYTTDCAPHLSPAGYISDGCIGVPRVTTPEYPEILRSICERYRIGMVVPTIDTELLLLSSLKDEFIGNGVRIIVPDLPFVSICRDKRKTAGYFESKGIRVPRPVDMNNPVFPIFAKPCDGSCSIGTRLISSADQITSELLADDRMMYMEWLDNKEYTEYTVDMYFGRDSCVKCIVPRERIEVRAGEISKGRTCRGFLVPFLKDRFANVPGCMGCICVQLFVRRGDDDIVGIEINPRFGGGYPLSEYAGARFPELLVREYFLGEEVPYSDGWKDGALMLRYDDAVFV